MVIHFTQINLRQLLYHVENLSVASATKKNGGELVQRLFRPGKGKRFSTSALYWLRTLARTMFFARCAAFQIFDSFIDRIVAPLLPGQAQRALGCQPVWLSS